MLRKIIIGLIVLSAAIGLFAAGWVLSDKQDDKDFNASIKPANVLVDSTISGDRLDEQYQNTSEVYKNTTTKEQFNQATANLKGVVISRSNSYVGDVDNFISYDLTSNSKSYNVVITTSKEKGKWKVTSFQVTERVQQ